MTNGIAQSLGLDIVNIILSAKFHHNILHNSRDRAIFTFSEFGARQSLDPNINVILQSLGLGFVNINVSANVIKIFQTV